MASKRHINRAANIRKYGITVAEYDQMLCKQGGRCAICNRIFSEIGKGKIAAPYIDHDHESGWVRGLLCHHCNMAIGMFGDDILRLGKAIEYLINTSQPTEWTFGAAREYCHKSTNPNMARLFSPETRRKRSENLRRRWTNPEYKARMREIQKIAQNGKEYKANMSLVCKAYSNTAEGRENKRKAGIARHANIKEQEVA